MCSKNFVPHLVACTAFLTMLSFSAKAQTHSLGEAWKTSSKPSSEATSKMQPVNPPVPSDAANSNKLPPPAPAQSVAAPSAAPIEPHIQPANPPLILEAEVTEINTTKLALGPGEEEWIGIEPPATFNATAYSLPGRTRAGTHVRRGVIAADPRVLPLGSLVHLKAGNYSGLYTVHDTGLAIKGKRIDVWMPSSREARSFGRQNVRLTVVKYGGGRKPKSKR